MNDYFEGARYLIILVSTVFSGFLGAWPGFIMVLTIIAFAIISQIGCPSLKFNADHTEDTDSAKFNNLTCNRDCKCSRTQFEPICSADGETHLFSPCLAGCQHVEQFKINQKNGKTIQKYSKCSCVLSNARETKKGIADPWPPDWLVTRNLLSNPLHSSGEESIDYGFSGFCPSDCSNQFNIFLGLFMIFGFFVGTERVPNGLILLRAIDKHDKAAALTVTVSFVSAFALLPSPIIFGSIYDGACMIWAEKCGEELNCIAYNTDKLRIGVGTTAIIFITLGLFCDTAVWYFAKGLNIYEDDHDKSTENDAENTDTTMTSYS